MWWLNPPKTDHGQPVEGGRERISDGRGAANEAGEEERGGPIEKMWEMYEKRCNESIHVGRRLRLNHEK